MKTPKQDLSDQKEILNKSNNPQLITFQSITCHCKF